MLTDGSDDQLQTAVENRLRQREGIWESNLMGGILGQVECILVVVNLFSVMERQCCCGGGDVRYGANLTWELYGTFGSPVIDPAADVLRTARSERACASARALASVRTLPARPDEDRGLR